MQNRLMDKIRGCYLAAAIGDAMGGPIETMHYEKIRRVFGTVKEFLEYKSPPGHVKIDTDAIPSALHPKPGSYTDDTIGRNLMTRAILKKGGRINADDFGYFMTQEVDPEYWWPAVMSSYYRIKFYQVPVRDAGLWNPPGGGVAWYTPIGILNACDPRQAAWDTFDVCSFLKRGVDRELTCGVQAAIAEAFKPNATIDSVVQAAMQYITREAAIHIEKAISLAQKCHDIEQLYERYYETLLVEWDALFQLKPSKLPAEATTSCDLREQVPVALAMFYFCKGDPKETIISAVNFGRDSDTIATTAGSVAGAFRGTKNLPAEWMEVCLQANPEPNMNELCEKLYGVLSKEIELKKELLGYIGQLA